ncbi:MAG: hypothetical protein QHC89_01790 [Bosea sp. (in: a-proteobacteria)]|nr:hypothetical protein [Bosea sp. (in: a-proteobacteria)]
MTQRAFAFSSAVAAQRSEPADSLDFFPTPPWATRAFVQHVALPVLDIGPLEVIRDPACGEGHMAEPLGEVFPMVEASDIHDYGYGLVRDFLDGFSRPVDWIITNPPFNAAIAFARQGLKDTRRGVALLVRTQWLHAIERYELFREYPPFLIAYYVERVPMHRGRWEPEGSTATDYCWVCWKHGAEPRAPLWIPPGRRTVFTFPTDAARFARPAPAPLLEPEA